LVSQEAGQGGAEVSATLDPDPGDGGVLVEPGGKLPVANRGVGEAGRGQAAAGLVDQAGQGVLVAIDAAEQLDHLRLVARRWSGGTQACVGVRTTLLSSDAADPAAFEGHSTGKAPTSGKVCGSHPPKAPGILTHR
jgi:hypothetical protein